MHCTVLAYPYNRLNVSKKSLARASDFFETQNYTMDLSLQNVVCMPIYMM